MTHLDIGGGIGAIQMALLDSGVTKVTDIDASSGYIAAARDEAEKQGRLERVHYYHGNFTDLAPVTDQADIVTLDKVICCYHDMQGLVSQSVAKARRYYGLVYPKDNFISKTLVHLANFMLKLIDRDFRGFIHETQSVDRLIRKAGFRQVSYETTLLWQIFLYKKEVN